MCVEGAGTERDPDLDRKPLASWKALAQGLIGGGPPTLLSPPFCLAPTSISVPASFWVLMAQTFSPISRPPCGNPVSWPVLSNTSQDTVDTMLFAAPGHQGQPPWEPCSPRVPRGPGAVAAQV